MPPQFVAVSYRIFVVEGDAATRIAQRTFKSFYFRRAPSLPQYAGRAITVATVAVELANGRPVRVIRIDTRRIRITALGAMDEDDHRETMRMALDRIGRAISPLPVRRADDGSVLYAKELFNDKRWKQSHPELSGPALRAVLQAIFGPSV